MSDKSVRYLAQISIVNARIEAMKIDNLKAEYQGLPPHWSSDHFEGYATDLEIILKDWENSKL